jgi:hypothetical protein
MQSLWSGYGEISRYFSPRLNRPIVVKHVCPPAQSAHPKGWNTSAGHQRKLQSYEVEARFYRDYALHCDGFCFVPKLLAQDQELQQQWLILEDLDDAGYTGRKTQLSAEDIKPLISWLAYFHGRFMQKSPEGLWPIGTYWHLATRQDEFQQMPSSALKDHALAIDHSLNQAQFLTLVHGDAKLANFCFSQGLASNAVAAVDFQYIGQGVGIKDLVYLLGSCFDQQALYDHELSLLQEYFKQLQQALKHYQTGLELGPIEQEWRDMYALAWADFHRFLLGWSPEHFKINDYMLNQTKIALGRF